MPLDPIKGWNPLILVMFGINDINYILYLVHFYLIKIKPYIGQSDKYNLDVIYPKILLEIIGFWIIPWIGFIRIFFSRFWMQIIGFLIGLKFGFKSFEVSELYPMDQNDLIQIWISFRIQ